MSDPTDQILTAVVASERRLSGQIRAVDDRHEKRMQDLDERLREVQVECGKITTSQEAASRDCDGKHRRSNEATNAVRETAKEAKEKADEAMSAADSATMRLDNLEDSDGPIARNGRSIDLLHSRALKVAGVVVASGGIGAGGLKLLELLF